MSELNQDTAALIKGMLARGDKQQDVAACFGINSARVYEIKAGQNFPEVKAALSGELPPAAPYPSPYDLWKLGRSMWGVRVALEAIEEKLSEALVAVRKAEMKSSVK